MDIDLVKKFLKVDYDDDNDYIELLINAAKEYVIDALGKCNEDIARVRLLELVIISDMYEKRSLSFNAATTNTNVQYAIRSIINQLQFGDDENE